MNKVGIMGGGCGGVLAELAESRHLVTVRNIPFLRWFGNYPVAAPDSRQAPAPREDAARKQEPDYRTKI